MQFEKGDGAHFSGETVNYLINVNEIDRYKIYAECPVPDEASDDYGYLTMKNAIVNYFKRENVLLPEPKFRFWYDGQEDKLAEDANANCDVYLYVNYDVG